MNNQTKAHINLLEGTIELEGSEEFVSKYLDQFKGKLLDRYSKKTEDNVEVQTEPKPALKSSVHKTSKTPTKVKSKSIDPEPFEIDTSADGKMQSLKDFFEQKKPSETVAHRIAVIGYYITKIRKSPSFTEGNVEFAYLALSLANRPVHLRQACIDAKNKNHYLEEVAEDPGKWKLSRIGEIFVDEKLPPKQIKNAD